MKQRKMQVPGVTMFADASLQAALPPKVEELLQQVMLNCLSKKRHFPHARRHQGMAEECISLHQEAAFSLEFVHINVKLVLVDNFACHSI